jgi:hypothetical protein
LNLRSLEPQYRIGWVCQTALAQLAVLPFIIAAVVTLAQGAAGLHRLVPGVIFCFIVAYSNAWVLLIEVNRSAHMKCLHSGLYQRMLRR